MRFKIFSNDVFLWLGAAGTYTIYSVLDNGVDHVNPLTYEDYPQLCDPHEREVMAIPHPALDTFKILDVRSGNKYLYSYG